MFPRSDPAEQAPISPVMSTCGEGQGCLPSCAPLSVPYVPFQPVGANQYDQAEALDQGTLFPGLNLPFHMKAAAANLPQTPLTQLQALEFVLVELGLYLDTHQDDAEAVELFRHYATLEKEMRAKYEAAYGPLTQPAAAGSKTWTWMKDPWPWNYQEGGK